jgi:hypothetical protein
MWLPYFAPEARKKTQAILSSCMFRLHVSHLPISPHAQRYDIPCYARLNTKSVIAFEVTKWLPMNSILRELSFIQPNRAAWYSSVPRLENRKAVQRSRAKSQL